MAENTATCQAVQNVERTLRHLEENLEAQLKELQTACAGTTDTAICCNIVPGEPVDTQAIRSRRERIRHLLDKVVDMVEEHAYVHPNLRRKPSRQAVDSGLGASAASASQFAGRWVQASQESGPQRCLSEEVPKRPGHDVGSGSKSSSKTRSVPIGATARAQRDHCPTSGCTTAESEDSEGFDAWPSLETRGSSSLLPTNNATPTEEPGNAHLDHPREAGGEELDAVRVTSHRNESVDSDYQGEANFLD